MPGAPLPPWRRTRLNLRYAAALRLADLVLRNESVETGPGRTTVAAFVTNMPAVFEDFVTTALAEALSRCPGRTTTQYATHLDEERRVRVRPDLLHLVGDRAVLVADAKYKVSSHSDDHQQMLAYCTVFALRRGWLVYARDSTPLAPSRIRNSDVTIIPVAIDLTAPTAELLAQLTSLALRMWDER